MKITIKALLYLMATVALSVAMTRVVPATASDEEKAPEKDVKKVVEYVGAKTCGTCHADYIEAVKKTKHAILLVDVGKKGEKAGCEACHGSGLAHLEDIGKSINNPSKMKPSEAAKICLKCHEIEEKVKWPMTLHAKADLTCVTCHNHPKEKRDEKDVRKVKSVESRKLLGISQPDLCYTCHGEKEAEMNLPSHHPVKEGKIKCTECHATHSNTPIEMARMGRKCVTCHQEKAGPFKREHRPVAEDCLTCHTPHGSMNQNLLTLRQPGLCLQCHTDTPVTHNTSQANYKTCNGCHVAIHGSNSTTATSKFNTFQ